MTNNTFDQRDLERMECSIERVTFHSSETGFCVLRAKVRGQRELVTIIGNIASITPGEYVKCLGKWITNKKHGLQFSAQHIQGIPPNTLEGIQKYLSSGLVKGIGPHFAKKLVQTFGESVFEVIENQPDRLMELTGIGKKRTKKVLQAWAQQKSIREIMIFLQSHGLGTARAVRIYKTYGNRAIEKVRDNPYRLASDIHGIGFKTADTLAQQLGISKDSILRARAGVHYVLQTLCEHGHCAAEYQQLIEASTSLLKINSLVIKAAIDHEANQEKLIIETIGEVSCVFPASLHHAESASAKHLHRILNGCPPWGSIDTAFAIPWVERKTGLKLANSQKIAIETVLKHKLTIITGGPGVGKTTIVNSILKLLQAKKMSVTLCAPTGRAAKRLTETTGLTAKTIHRLLIFDPKTFSFKHTQENPLPYNVIVIDEASMIEIVLLYHLLKAVPDHTALLFVGDIDQLPSVGPGAILMDMIRSGVIPTVRLHEIFRQAASSRIIINAHRINQGEMPLLNEAADNDFYTIYAKTPEEIENQLIELVSVRIPKYLNCDPIVDVQVLTPMNRGGLGSIALNIALQKKLNGHAEPKITRYGLTLSPGDKVIQMINNYDKDIFNGDIGFVSHIDLAKNVVKVCFDQRMIDYDFNELDEISLAYAISIHKSQGSEFPVVVIPIGMQHYMLLARNLLYTGVTRGRRMVVLIGEKKAIAMAINNNRENKRLTKLSQRLKDSVTDKSKSHL